MDIITNADFNKKIKTDADGYYLFYGEEDYLKAHAIKALKDAMGIDESLEIFNYVTLDVLDYSADKLIDILSMPPMMAEKKLVVVTGLNIKKMSSRANASEFNDFLDALGHLNEFDYNVFVLSIPNGNITEELPKKAPTGALKTLADILQPVKFEAPTPAKLALWAVRHFEHHGISANAQDCSLLVDYCGKNMFTLTGEIEKLALYARAKGRNELLREDITTVCTAEMEYGAFEFSNAILDGRKGEALSILSVMKFKQIDPLIIMGELSGIFSDLLKIKIMLLTGKNNQQISAETGINIHKVGIYVTSARRMELDRLRAIVSMATDVDLAMKYRYDSGYLHLEKLICSL
jgi:DNA polymerase-3 subunit delta